MYPTGYPPYPLPAPPMMYGGGGGGGAPYSTQPMPYTAPSYVTYPPAPPPSLQIISSPPVAVVPSTSTIIARPAMTAEERLANTVYVGKIPTTVDDDFMRQLLECCGRVITWRRQTLEGGQPCGFGFCDYEGPECVLRALRILNGCKLEDKELIVKVGEEAQNALDSYKKKKIVTQRNIAEETKQEEEEDQRALSRIKQLIATRSQSDRSSSHGSGVGIEDKSKLVSAQIKHFRDTQALKEKERKHSNDLKDREMERRDRAKLRESREKERERERNLRIQEEREYRERERRLEEREREKLEREKERKREDTENHVRTLKERERRRKERERETQEDAEDRKSESHERDIKYASEHPSANLPLYEKQQTTSPNITNNNTQTGNNSMLPSSIGTTSSPMSPPNMLSSPQSPPNSGFLLGSEISVSFVPGTKKRAAAPAPGNVFSNEDEGDQWVPRKKRELVKLDSTSSTTSTLNINAIAEKIPSKKEDVFGYPINWALFDQAELAEKRLKPWISKKIVEYLGEEEMELLQVIVNKLKEHSSPTDILSQLSIVFDEETEGFVLKLWRLIIFELLRLQATT